MSFERRHLPDESGEDPRVKDGVPRKELDQDHRDKQPSRPAGDAKQPSFQAHRCPLRCLDFSYQHEEEGERRQVVDSVPALRHNDRTSGSSRFRTADSEEPKIPADLKGGETGMGEQQTYSWLDDLNPQQRAAVTHRDGPLLVVAGAGSGKTKTLAYRVAYLIAEGVDPEKILLLTFTRRAAQEMLSRASAIMHRGAPTTGRVWGGTFHAMANRLLRRYNKAVGLRRDFTVLDQGDSEDLINLIRHEMGLHSREKRFPRKSTCLAIYSRCVNGKDDLPLVLERYFPWCSDWETELKSIFQQYVARKQKRNVLDYDDLLLYWAELVREGEIADQVSGQFDHVLVDEYQDTNRVQAEILRGMYRANGGIMVVGDDAQSIYGFRAATVRNMLEFPEMFSGTTVIKLEENYRSVAPILETTNRVIAQSSQRFAKELWSARGNGENPKLVMCKDEAQQDEYVIERVLEHYEQGIPLHRQAVLFRASHLSASLELELTRRDIPYHKFGGLRFLEAAHIKDTISFLRILENPRDEMAWFRVLQLLDGVGPACASRVVEHVVAARFDPRAIGTFDAPPAARDRMAELSILVDELVPFGTKEPAAQVARIRRFYEPVLKKLYENPRVRARDLESLEQIASGYRSRRKFLVDLQLDPPNSTSDLAGSPFVDEDWLVLSTIHSAKGCEWDSVYLIHAADGFLPSDMAAGSKEEIEEELRVAYVALTRARDFLYVTWPLRYYSKWYALGDRHSYAQPSRFLTEDVRATMDEVVTVDEPEQELTIDTVIRRNIAERMRSMWE